MKVQDIALALAFLLTPFSLPALVYGILRFLAWLLGGGC